MNQGECEWLSVNNETKGVHGGMVRGPNGGWMGAFEMKIGLPDIFQVEA